MDNLKDTAYPIVDTSDKSSISPGFTKLELASLMIAQGLCADPNFGGSKEMIASVAVSQAKAVLEEANK